MKSRVMSFSLMGILLLLLPLRAEQPKVSSSDSVDIVGLWKGRVVTSEGERIFTLKFSRQEGKIVGVGISHTGVESPLQEVTLDGNNLSFTVTFEREGQTITLKVKGVVEGNTIKGTIEGPRGSIEWTAQRVPPYEKLLGIWRVKAEIAGEPPQEYVLNLQSEGGKLKGLLSGGDLGEVPIPEIILQGEEFQCTFTVRQEGGEFQVLCKGTFSGDLFRGTATVADQVYQLTGKKETPVVEGQWDLVVVTPSQTYYPKVTFKREGEKIMGTFHTEMGDVPVLEASLKGSELRFVIALNFGQEVRFEFIGTLEGDRIKGKVRPVGSQEEGVSFSGTRVKPTSEARKEGMKEEIRGEKESR